MPHVCWSAVDGELKHLVAFGKFVSNWICPRKLSALRSNGAVNATVRVSERDGKAGGGKCGLWHVDDKVRKVWSVSRGNGDWIFLRDGWCEPREELKRLHLRLLGAKMVSL